jgi:PAS domain S-box-containing protein
MQTNENSWVREFPGAITVCDRAGIIIEMNEQAIQLFAKRGGRELIGKSVLDCHPEPARSQLKEMLEKPRRNAYTMEKNGVRRLIYHAPWYRKGEYAGLVGMALEVPAELPHHARS